MFKYLISDKTRSGALPLHAFALFGRTALLPLLALLILSVTVEAKVKAPKKDCHAYVVMDAGSGRALFGQDANKVIYPASTAKLMTAIVCIENGDVDSKIKTSSEVLSGVTFGTYCLGLEPGRTFTFKDLLSLSLISSAADATDSLAVGVFGSREACVEAMNEKCQEMGLKHTHFDNPVGSDIGAGFDETYSTAREMALITRYAMAIPLIRETVKKPYYDTTSGQEINANSTNWFTRGVVPYNRDRYRIIGSKSGTTNAAGHVFIATAVDDEGHEVICGYFGGPSKESTFAGIRDLYNHTFKQYDKGRLILTPKCDDVRISDMKNLYDTYAVLNTYPVSADGRFNPYKPITRPQLARLIKNIDATKANPGMASVAKVFASENKKGYVTAADAASFIQSIYPSHLSEEKIGKILEGCSGTEILDDSEKEAFAVFVNSGLLPDESCRNAKHRLTRKQGLILADHLADYQIGYAARHPVGEGLLLPVDLSKDPPAPGIAADDRDSETEETTTAPETATQAKGAAESSSAAEADVTTEAPAAADAGVPTEAPVAAAGATTEVPAVADAGVPSEAPAAEAGAPSEAPAAADAGVPAEATAAAGTDATSVTTVPAGADGTSQAPAADTTETESPTGSSSEAQAPPEAETSTEAVAPCTVEILTTAPPMLWNYKWKKYYRRLALRLKAE